MRERIAYSKPNDDGSEGSEETLAAQKQQLWAEKMRQLETPGAYGYVIDAGIRETVAALQLNGFHTTQSDQGNYGNTPWVQVEAGLPTDVYVGEQRVKAGIMASLAIHPEEMDEKSPRFDRVKQVEVEEGAREQLLREGAAFTPEFEKWRADTMQMVERLQAKIDEFYVTRPRLESFPELKTTIVFPYRTPNHSPYIHDVPLLEVISTKPECDVPDASPEQHEQIVIQRRAEMSRFTEFLRDQFFLRN
jgi:hypothetical protein